MQPTMVVPVDVALGRGTPWACSARFLLWLEKSKPGIVRMVDVEEGRMILVLLGDSRGQSISKMPVFVGVCVVRMRKECDCLMVFHLIEAVL